MPPKLFNGLHPNVSPVSEGTAERWREARPYPEPLVADSIGVDERGATPRSPGFENVSIPAVEQKKLFALSGNRCAYPDCRKLLIAAASVGDELIVLGEAAHIVGESELGPRGQSPMRLSERNLYPNLMLLCSRHHQLVDAEPARYTVELLHRYKDEHEASIQQRVGPVSDDAAPPHLLHDTIYSTLLPVERMPQCIFSAPCSLAESEVAGKLGALRGGEMAPYLLRTGKLIAFQDLTDPTNPFAALADPDEVERIDPHTWWIDPDKSR